MRSCSIVAKIYTESDRDFLVTIKIVDSETGEIVKLLHRTYHDMPYSLLCDHIKRKSYDAARNEGFGQVDTFNNEVSQK